MNSYKSTTSGERLFKYIFVKLEDDKAWKYLNVAIKHVGHGDQLVLYYRQHAALYLTCKLISSGKSVTAMECENSSIIAPYIEGFPWNHFNEGGKLLRFLTTAIRNTDRPISAGVAFNMKSYSKREHPWCYICGTYLDHQDKKSRAFYTAEHLWPSCYGGDSIEENLLPACADCNHKKDNIVTWVSTNVHSLHLHSYTNSQQLLNIEFQHRYALYNRKAISLALCKNLSLKNAFLMLGPWRETRVHDTEL